MERFNRLYIALALAAVSTLSPATALAQQLHEKIDVDGRYVPEIVRVDRIYAFPEAMKFSLDATPLPYVENGVPAQFRPWLTRMPVTGWRVTRHFDRHRGYVEAGLGSWLSSTLSAGFKAIDTRESTLGARLQFNSTSLWKTPKSVETAPDTKRELYDGTIAFYGSHVFSGVGRLDATLSWHQGYFNYYSFAPSYSTTDTKAPSQTLTDISARVGWQSPRSSENAVWNLSADVRHFGFRTLPYPDGSAKGITPARETSLDINGGVFFPWGESSSAGLDASFTSLLYSSQDPAPLWLLSSSLPVKGLDRVSAKRESASLLPPDSYSQIALTPFYRFSRGLLNIRIGAEIDLTFNAGPENRRYPVFHIAPDVRLDLQSGQFGMWLNALGGSRLQTLAAQWDADPYCLPTVASTRPVYTPLDASLGFGLGPFSGFSMGIEGGYRISRAERLGGWYAAQLSLGSRRIQGLVGAGTPLYSFDTEGVNLSGFSVGVNAKYAYGKIFEISAEGHYQPQKGKTGYFNGYDRPRLTASIGATLRPWRGLRLSVGYDYRGVRNIYTRALTSSNPSISIDGSASATELQSLRLPDITLLNAGVSYDFTPRFGLWVEAMNLLNRHDDWLPMLPSQGLTVMGGFKVIF